LPVSLLVKYMCSITGVYIWHNELWSNVLGPGDEGVTIKKR
jgi:hypothetical protein